MPILVWYNNEQFKRNEDKKTGLEQKEEGWKKEVRKGKWMQKSIQGRYLEKCPVEMHMQRDKEKTQKGGLDGKGNKGG